AAAASDRRWCTRCGLPPARRPPRRPRRHPYLAQRVKVEIGIRDRCGEQLWHSPRQARERLAQQALLLPHVSVVVLQWLAAAEQPQRLPPGMVARPVDAGHFTRLVVQRHPPGVTARGVTIGESAIVSQVPDEL